MNIYYVIIGVLNIIGFVCFFKYKKPEYGKIFKYTREALILEFSIISLIIAISLYDQFGLNKKLTEKRVELIIELLTELKRQDGFGTHYKINGGFISNPSFYFQKNIAKKNIEIYSDDNSLYDILNSPIAMELDDFDNAFKRTREILNNPIMPELIVEKSQFLRMDGGIGINKNNQPQKLVFLHFTNEGKIKLVKKETKSWVHSNKNNCSLLEFLEKFDSLFKACKDWTDKHSNMDEELNLERF